MQPQTKGRLVPPGAGRGKKNSLSRALEGVSPSGTLISDSGLQKPERRNPYCFQPSHLW